MFLEIDRILELGNKLVESGHYASQVVRLVAGKLDHERKAFVAGLTDRTAVLGLSATFHRKAEDVSIFSSWCFRTSSYSVTILISGLTIVCEECRNLEGILWNGNCSFGEPWFGEAYRRTRFHYQIHRSSIYRGTNTTVFFGRTKLFTMFPILNGFGYVSQVHSCSKELMHHLNRLVSFCRRSLSDYVRCSIVCVSA